jgi:hypothetical protein
MTRKFNEIYQDLVAAKKRLEESTDHDEKLQILHQIRALLEEAQTALETGS